MLCLRGKGKNKECQETEQKDRMSGHLNRGGSGTDMKQSNRPGPDILKVKPSRNPGRWGVDFQMKCLTSLQAYINKNAMYIIV